MLQNIDDLFEREELSAVSDVGWPDCFNSGVFVFQPSEKTYTDLLQFAVTKGSFDGNYHGGICLKLDNYFLDNKLLPVFFDRIQVNVVWVFLYQVETKVYSTCSSETGQQRTYLVIFRLFITLYRKLSTAINRLSNSELMVICVFELHTY